MFLRLAELYNKLHFFGIETIATEKPPAKKKRRGNVAAPFLNFGLKLNLYYVYRLRAFFALAYLELYFLAFVKGLKTIALDRGIMDEDVAASLFLDKSIAFGIVKPLHLARCH
jgi:hypothetical protein